MQPSRKYSLNEIVRSTSQQQKKTGEKTYTHHEHFLNADGDLFFIPRFNVGHANSKLVINGLQYLTITDQNRLEPLVRDWSRKIFYSIQEKYLWIEWA